MRTGSRGTTRPWWWRTLPEMPVSFFIFSFEFASGDLLFGFLLGGMN
jgi:hypothetical protein